MNFPNVGGHDEMENSLKCAVLIVMVNELGPVSRRNGDENVMKQVVPWCGGGGFCDQETAWKFE